MTRGATDPAHDRGPTKPPSGTSRPTLAGPDGLERTPLERPDLGPRDVAPPDLGPRDVGAHAATFTATFRRAT